jgi:putative membrane protein
MFAKHHDLMMATLAGVLAGSLRKVWPWKEVVATRINSHGLEVPVSEVSRLPSGYGVEFLLALALFGIGVFLILYLDRVGATEEKVKDVGSKKFEKTHKKALKTQR